MRAWLQSSPCCSWVARSTSALPRSPRSSQRSRTRSTARSRRRRRKEAERKADLERRIREISATPAQCIGKTSAQLQEVLDSLNTLPLADFQEYREQAAKAQFDAQQAVRTLLHAGQAGRGARRTAGAAAPRGRAQGCDPQAIDAIAAPLQQLPMCRTAARVQTLIDNVRAVNIADEVYQEFAAAAREKKSEVLATLISAQREKQVAEDARAAAPTPTPAPSAGPAAAHVHIPMAPTRRAPRPTSRYECDASPQTTTASTTKVPSACAASSAARLPDRAARSPTTSSASCPGR
jgi:hypothetical protein